PVALARHAPVAQAVVHLALADARRFHAPGDRFLGLGHGHSIEEIGIDEDRLVALLLEEGLGADHEACRVRSFRRYHRYDRKAILAREIEIALVMRRTAENGALA